MCLNAVAAKRLECRSMLAIFQQEKFLLSLEMPMGITVRVSALLGDSIRAEVGVFDLDYPQNAPRLKMSLIECK